MLFNSTPIQMEWFYNLHGYKTKLNWFLMEFAMDYYDHIMHSPQLEIYRKHHKKFQIAQFCAYFSRRLKESLLKCLSGKRKSVIFYQDYIADFYPHFTDERVQVLNDIAQQSWDQMIACDVCPEQCLRYYEHRSYQFDRFEG